MDQSRRQLPDERGRYNIRAPTIPRMGFSLTRTKSKVKEAVAGGLLRSGSNRSKDKDPSRYDDASDEERDNDVENIDVRDIEDVGEARIPLKGGSSGNQDDGHVSTGLPESLSTLGTKRLDEKDVLANPRIERSLSEKRPTDESEADRQKGDVLEKDLEPLGIGTPTEDHSPLQSAEPPSLSDVVKRVESLQGVEPESEIKPMESSLSSAQVSSEGAAGHHVFNNEEGSKGFGSRQMSDGSDGATGNMRSSPIVVEAVTEEAVEVSGSSTETSSLHSHRPHGTQTGNEPVTEVSITNSSDIVERNSTTSYVNLLGAKVIAILLHMFWMIASPIRLFCRSISNRRRRGGHACIQNSGEEDPRPETEGSGFLDRNNQNSSETLEDRQIECRQSNDKQRDNTKTECEAGQSDSSTPGTEHDSDQGIVKTASIEERNVEDTVYDEILDSIIMGRSSSAGSSHSSNPEPAQKNLFQSSEQRETSKRSHSREKAGKSKVVASLKKLSSRLSNSSSTDVSGWTQVPSRRDIGDTSPRANNLERGKSLSSAEGSLDSIENAQDIDHARKRGSGSSHHEVCKVEDQIAEQEPSEPSNTHILSTSGHDAASNGDSVNAKSPGLPHSTSSPSSSSCTGSSPNATTSEEKAPERDETPTEPKSKRHSTEPTRSEHEDSSSGSLVRGSEPMTRQPAKAGRQGGRKNVMQVKSDAKSMLRALGVSRRGAEDTRFASSRSARKTMSVLADLMTNEMGVVCSVRKSGAFKMAITKVFDVQHRLNARVSIEPLDDFSCNVIFSRERGDKTDRAVYIDFVNSVHQAFVSKTSQGQRTPGF